MQTVEVECLAGNRYAYAPEVSRDNALIVLKASGQQLGRRAPINVCLCIDRSGSMEGPPLEYVKRACEYVVDMLEPNDILSIVTFEEQVDVLMPARRVVNKALVKEHIRRLEVGNTTNLYDGLMAGCMQIQSVMAQTPGYVNRVLLLTDGEPTVGLKDYTSIVQQVAEQKAQGHLHHRARLRAGVQRGADGGHRAAQRRQLLLYPPPRPAPRSVPPRTGNPDDHRRQERPRPLPTVASWVAGAAGLWRGSPRSGRASWR